MNLLKHQKFGEVQNNTVALKYILQIPDGWLLVLLLFFFLFVLPVPCIIEFNGDLMYRAPFTAYKWKTHRPLTVIWVINYQIHVYIIKDYAWTSQEHSSLHEILDFLGVWNLSTCNALLLFRMRDFSDLKHLNPTNQLAQAELWSPRICKYMYHTIIGVSIVSTRTFNFHSVSTAK